MVGRKMNKVEGAKETCFCGSPVVCVKISYQGNESLQWQNADGKAHYNPRNDDGTFPPCNSTVPKKDTTKAAATDTKIVQPGTLDKVNVESSIALDFEKIYRSGIPIAERIAREAILFGQPQTDKEVSVVVQCVMKAYIQYWIAKTK